MTKITFEEWKKDYESDEELKESTESELSEIRNAQRYMDLQTEVMP